MLVRMHRHEPLVREEVGCAAEKPPPVDGAPLVEDPLVEVGHALRNRAEDKATHARIELLHGGARALERWRGPDAWRI